MATVVPAASSWAPHTHSHLHKRKHSSSAAAVSFLPVSDLRDKESERDPEAGQSSVHSIKIKPYLRKLSLRDGANTLDLSRPSAENEGIASLGLYDESRSGSGSDLAFSPTSTSRSRHQRSQSNNSTFSNSSSHQRPTVPYAKPFTHTPRPYTPPIARSYTASSLLGSEDSADAEADDTIMSDEEFRARQRAFDSSHRSGSIGSLPAVPHPIHTMHSSSSLTRLNMSNPSLSSLPSLPTSRSRGDTLRSVDTISSSRTSMDKAIHLIRGGPSEPQDPAARADAIRALRVAYAEKQEAKERRYAEKEQLKQQDKRRARKDSAARNSESSARGTHNEKTEFIGKAYSDYDPTHAHSLPKHIRTPGSVPAAARADGSTHTAKSRSLKTRWLAFLAWFRTRLLRMGRKMRRGK